MRLATKERAEGTDLDSAIEYMVGRSRELIPVALSQLAVDPESGQLLVGDGQSYEMTKHAATQLATKTHVTASYVLRIDDHIAAANFNRFLPTTTGHAQLAVEDGAVVGILRAGTVPVDPTVLFESVDSELRPRGFNVSRWWSAPSGIMFRMTSERLTVEPKVGDLVQAGVDLMIRENAEATLGVRGSLLRLICTNGAVTPENTGLKRSVIKDGWKDPNARLAMALNAAVAEAEACSNIAAGLKLLARQELELPDDGNGRVGVLRTGLRQIHPRPVSAKPMVESIVDALYQEDGTMFGLYNALTRLGRDSMDLDRKDVLESAGYNLITNSGAVLDAIAEANSIIELGEED